MNLNLGSLDRIFRVGLGAVLFFAPFLNLPAIWSNGVFAYASMGVGVVLAATAVFGFCPIYKILGVSSGSR